MTAESQRIEAGIKITYGRRVCSHCHGDTEIFRVWPLWPRFLAGDLLLCEDCYQAFGLNNKYEKKKRKDMFRA